MPELPEVETIRRQLEKEVKSRTIEAVEVRFAGRLNMPAKEFAKAVSGARITSVGRRAKLLLIGLSSGWTMVVHLKMTGRFLLVPAGAAPTKHTHLVFGMSDGRRLLFEDTRKFGFVKLIRTEELGAKVFAKERYGPEPLEPSFTAAVFASCIRSRGNKKIKPLLMDQTCIAGIGNIYADEACWKARVRPTRPARALSEAELKALWVGARQAMRQALEDRGTSADMYVDLYGEQGDHVPKLEAYGRDGQKCRRCGGVIKKIRLAGRGAHYCPVCQR